MKSEVFVIPLNGLHTGKTSFSWCVGREFFAEFDNSDILDADLKVDVTIDKSGSYTGIDCMVGGDITVLCDRCLEELELPVQTEARFSVKFGDESVAVEDSSSDDGVEVMYVPNDESGIDMSQVIYDYALLALPMHRVHNEGECNPDVLKHLGKESAESENAGEVNENSPFSALKDLFKN